MYYAGADLSNMDLTEYSFRGANLMGADLSYSNLRGVDFRGATLTGASLVCANLKEANLRDTILMGADLTRTILHNTVMAEATLYGTNFYGADLLGASLKLAFLYETNLTDANLRYAVLTGAYTGEVIGVLFLPVPREGYYVPYLQMKDGVVMFGAGCEYLPWSDIDELEVRTEFVDSRYKELIEFCKTAKFVNKWIKEQCNV